MYERDDPCCCEPEGTPGRDPHQWYEYPHLEGARDGKRCIHCNVEVYH